MRIHDARKPCKIKGRTFFFDTNVWININGFDPRPHMGMYSDYFKSLLDAGNEVATSDLVISEFHNRCCKIEHRRAVHSGATSEENYKRFRASAAAQEFTETVRDTCLNLCEEHSVEQFAVDGKVLSAVIEECAEGILDYNDVLIRMLCLERDFVLVTHDADFTNCGLEVVTANPRILRNR